MTVTRGEGGVEKERREKMDGRIWREPAAGWLGDQRFSFSFFLPLLPLPLPLLLLLLLRLPYADGPPLLLLLLLPSFWSVWGGWGEGEVSVSLQPEIDGWMKDGALQRGRRLFSIKSTSQRIPRCQAKTDAQTERAGESSSPESDDK